MHSVQLAVHMLTKYDVCICGSANPAKQNEMCIQMGEPDEVRRRHHQVARLQERMLKETYGCRRKFTLHVINEEVPNRY